MTFLLPLLSRLAWWIVPKFADTLVDYVSRTLSAVELAEQIEDPNLRRQTVLQQVDSGGLVPETVMRFLIEACVILLRLGITSRQLVAMEKLLSDTALGDLATPTTRNVVLSRFATLFPDVPERIGRLLFELVSAKLKGGSA